MANVLRMEKQILVRQLLELGWSYREIERQTGIRRETISKYAARAGIDGIDSDSKAAKVPTDPDAYAHVVSCAVRRVHSGAS